MDVKVDGDKVIVTFELAAPRPSRTGKTDIRFTTGGFVPVSGTDLRINLTVVEPPRRRAI